MHPPSPLQTLCHRAPPSPTRLQPQVYPQSNPIPKHQPQLPSPEVPHPFSKSPATALQLLWNGLQSPPPSQANPFPPPHPPNSPRARIRRNVCPVCAPWACPKRPCTGQLSPAAVESKWPIRGHLARSVHPARHGHKLGVVSWSIAATPACH